MFSKAKDDTIVYLKERLADLERARRLDAERIDRLIEALGAKAGVQVAMPYLPPELPKDEQLFTVPSINGHTQVITADQLSNATSALWKYARGPAIASPVKEEKVPAPSSNSKGD